MILLGNELQELEAYLEQEDTLDLLNDVELSEPSKYTGTLNDYLKEISRYPLLNAAEERSLSMTIADEGQQGVFALCWKTRSSIIEKI